MDEVTKKNCAFHDSVMLLLCEDTEARVVAGSLLLLQVVAALLEHVRQSLLSVVRLDAQQLHVNTVPAGRRMRTVRLMFMKAEILYDSYNLHVVSVL